jgi:hypothetical protein
MPALSKAVPRLTEDEKKRYMFPELASDECLVKKKELMEFSMGDIQKLKESAFPSKERSKNDVMDFYQSLI